MLTWAVEELTKLGLEKDEAISETYLLCGRLVRKFDTRRSSIIPYIERALPWEMADLIKKLKKQYGQDKLKDIQIREKHTRIQEEFYWNPNKILFLDRYVGKVFTKGQKYLINKILTFDGELTNVDLAENLGISRDSVANKLQNIKETIQHGG